MIKTASGQTPTDAVWDQLVAKAPAHRFYAVITTGVVCRPGCPARLPLRKNVRIFADLPPALEAGFRPCKRCKPQMP